VDEGGGGRGALGGRPPRFFLVIVFGKIEVVPGG
jgi:hypothetical protein